MGFIKTIFKTFKNKATDKNEEKIINEETVKSEKMKIDHDLSKSLNQIKSDLGNSSDLSVHCAKSEKLEYAILFIKF